MSNATNPNLIEPLLVSVREACRLLGGIGHNQFWKMVKAGELELVGSEREREGIYRGRRTA